MLLLCFIKVQAYLFQAAGDFKALDTIGKGDLAKKLIWSILFSCLGEKSPKLLKSNFLRTRILQLSKSGNNCCTWLAIARAALSHKEPLPRVSLLALTSTVPGQRALENWARVWQGNPPEIKVKEILQKSKVPTWRG